MGDPEPEIEIIDRQGRRGFPAGAKCPGCWGAVEVSIAGTSEKAGQ